MPEIAAEVRLPSSLHAGSAIIIPGFDYDSVALHGWLVCFRLDPPPNGFQVFLLAFLETRPKKGTLKK